MSLHQSARLVVATLIAMGLSSCSSLQQSINPQPDLHPSRPRALVPQEFLFTDYAPLNNWLDESVRVDIQDVPLSSVFQVPALAGLNHDLTGFTLPADKEEPTVTVDEVALTRRQLLWAISQDHKLIMVPKFDAVGGTSYIDIRSN